MAAGVAAGAAVELAEGAAADADDPDELDAGADEADDDPDELDEDPDAPDEGTGDVADDADELTGAEDALVAEVDELDDGVTALVTGAVADLTALVTPEAALLTPETSEDGPDAEAPEAARRHSARATMLVAIVQRGLNLSLSIPCAFYPMNPKLIQIEYSFTHSSGRYLTKNTPIGDMGVRAGRSAWSTSRRPRLAAGTRIASAL